MMDKTRYEHFADICKDTAKTSDSQIIGLIKTWKKILRDDNERLKKAQESHENSVCIYTAFKAIAYARGLEVTDEDLYMDSEKV